MKAGASRGDDGSAAGGREDLENIAITALEGKAQYISNVLQCSFSRSLFHNDWPRCEFRSECFNSLWS